MFSSESKGETRDGDDVVNFANKESQLYDVFTTNGINIPKVPRLFFSLSLSLSSRTRALKIKSLPFCFRSDSNK